MIVIVGGFLVGVMVGRWWALLAAVALGVWIGLETEVEIPHWLLGTVYAVLAGGGIAGGVLLRKALARR